MAKPSDASHTDDLPQSTFLDEKCAEINPPGTKYVTLMDYPPDEISKPDPDAGGWN
jgi:hypothetical protein